MFDASRVQSRIGRDLATPVPRGAVSLRAEQWDVLRGTRGNAAVEGVDRSIDGILRHDPIGRPLAARDDDKPRNRMGDDVLPRQFGALLGFAGQKWAQPCVHSLDILAGQRDR